MPTLANDKEQKKVEKWAKKLGMTPSQFETLGKAAVTVYQYVADDLSQCCPRKSGLWKQSEIIEIVMDAGRVEQELRTAPAHYPEAEAVAEILSKHEIDWNVLRSAMKVHFPYKWYE